jgi:hypothetical protein
VRKIPRKFVEKVVIWNNLLQFPLQIGSNLDKKSTMVIYKVCTINKLTCMNNNPQFKKILNLQIGYLRSKSLKKPEN